MGASRNGSLKGLDIKSKIKVVIVEDEPIVRACLVEDINQSDEFCVVAAVDSVAQAKAIAPASYAILLLDLNLSDGHGNEILLFLSELKDRPKVLILSSLGDKQTVLNSVAAGADGYLLKDSSTAEVLQSLHNVINGESASSPSVTKILIDALRLQAHAPGLADAKSAKILAPRELDVLKLLARGKSYQQTADEMGVAYSTVSHYVKQLYHKLNVRSKNEAIYKAISDGLIHL